METIKKYLAGWDAPRIIRLVLGLGLIIGYFASKENMYLLGGIVISGMAILNVGCPGGTCATPAPKDESKPVMTFEKLETKDKKNV